jgi:Tfp pilus assembly protein PilF
MRAMKNVHSKCLSIFAVAVLLSACTGVEKPAGSAGSASAKPEDAKMKEGLDLLYQKNDPFGAEDAFRAVLAANPSHYGAHFQLARALDHEGKPTEARTLYQDVLKSAEAMKDTATIGLIQARLALPDTVSTDAIMAGGLNELYRRNNPTAAADLFKKVLERNPSHYGATYQIASALDKAGKRSEARPYWEKTLAMAITYKDKSSEETARARLKQTP